MFKSVSKTYTYKFESMGKSFNVCLYLMWVLFNKYIRAYNLQMRTIKSYRFGIFYPITTFKIISCTQCVRKNPTIMPWNGSLPKIHAQ